MREHLGKQSVDNRGNNGKTIMQQLGEIKEKLKKNAGNHGTMQDNGGRGNGWKIGGIM